jgi:hypothetical protein
VQARDERMALTTVAVGLAKCAGFASLGSSRLKLLRRGSDPTPDDTTACIHGQHDASRGMRYPPRNVIESWHPGLVGSNASPVRPRGIDQQVGSGIEFHGILASHFKAGLQDGKTT